MGDEVRIPHQYRTRRGPYAEKSRRTSHITYRTYRAVEGHFDHPHGRSWMYIADFVHPHFATLVGEPRLL